MPIASEVDLTAPDVTAPDVLSRVFSEEHLRTTIRRMRSWKESENEVAHPLRTLILLECGDALAKSLAAAVPAGAWKPSPAYVVLVSKRSGTYRELVFPSLVDSLVSRRIIDTLEPSITKGDNERAFFGRSHSNTDRRRGDYENWFKVWLDYSAKIGAALEKNGFTYVFDTDITQFFPSVDRERAKRALAQRTSAHQALLELLFYCLDAWAPRVRYCAVPGLPIEPNDVSRLVAHNYIKSVDEHFVNDTKVHYLRWVDDTVVFVPDELSAHEVKRRHHLALREVGLSPNASKTSIQSASEFSESRHPEFNRRLSDAHTPAELEPLIAEWFARSPETTANWDKVATRLYSSARRKGLESLRQRVVEDVVRSQSMSLQRAALKYLRRFAVTEPELSTLVKYFGGFATPTEAQIEVARFLCDALLEKSELGGAIVNLSLGQLMSTRPREGSGYARALLLLALNKHGDKAARTRVRESLTIDRLDDDQLRLHYLYVFKCRKELEPGLESAARHLDTPDIALAMRLCDDALGGRLTRHGELLKSCISSSGRSRTIRANHLPLLFAMLRAPGKEEENLAWLKNTVDSPKSVQFGDEVITRFLAEELAIAKR